MAGNRIGICVNAVQLKLLVMGFAKQLESMAPSEVATDDVMELSDLLDNASDSLEEA